MPLLTIDATKFDISKMKASSIASKANPEDNSMVVEDNLFLQFPAEVPKDSSLS